jgi:serine protease AprX
MKKITFILFGFFSISAFSQEDAWVFFNAKPNAQYFYDNPLQMLSQRALDRRTTQGIALDIKDIPLHQPFVDQITATSGITVLAKSKWLNMLHIKGAQTDIANLNSLSFVDHIQYANHSLNPSFRGTSKKLENKKINKWQNIEANYNYGNSGTQAQMLNTHILHQQNYTGAGKIVAIMDAGFPGVNTTDPFKRLRDNGLILGGYDFVNNTTNPYTGFQHGTQVLSNMGGYVDGQLVGTAPDAKYYLFITEDNNQEMPIEETNWIEAAEMADSLGVDVINTSLGYFGYDNASYSYQDSDLDGTKAVISRAADIAFSRGMICVTSAGNSGSSAHPYVAVPADAANNIAVGAVNASEVKASFSSIGLPNDGRFKPDLMAMGVASTVATQTGAISTNSGTSFAGPILAGSITSFWSAFPNKKNSEIIALVRASADKFNNPNDQYGYGIPDFQLALNTALSIPEVDSFSFTLFPNPTSNLITITSSEKYMNATVTIYNNVGQTVFIDSIKNKMQNFSLESLTNGVYFYDIASAEIKLNGKIIKN